MLSHNNTVRGAAHGFKRGFTLVELSIVIIIVSLLMAGGLAVGTSMVEKAAYIDTQKQLQQIRKSLRDFYTVNGHLPCVAPLNTLPGTDGFGVAIANCSTSATVPSGTFRQGSPAIRVGMIPTRTLGLSDSAASDQYGSRIVYAVTEDLTDASLFGAEDGGITVLDKNDNDINSQAAYAIISAGRDRKGSYRYAVSTSEAAASDSCGTTGALDIENCILTNTAFRDAPYNDGETDMFYDDLMLWTPKFHLSSTTAASDTLWAANGDENLYSVGTDGETTNTNVGIGTDLPTEKLDVNGNLRVSTGYLGASDHGSQYMHLTHSNYGAQEGKYALLQNGQNGNLYLNSVDDGHIYFRTDNEYTPSHMIIRGDTGRIGIGINNPQYKLDVNGHARFGNVLIHSNNGNILGNRDSANSAVTLSAGPSGNHRTELRLTANDSLDTSGSIRIFGRNVSGFEGQVRYLSSSRLGSGSTAQGTPLHVFRKRGNNVNPTTLMQIRASGRMVVYGDGATCTIGGAGGTYCSSDTRWKKDVTTIENPLERIRALRGVYYRWNDNAPLPDKNARHIGVIAQEVQAVFPEAVMEQDSTGEDKTPHLSVSMEALVPPLIESVKALEARIIALEKENAALKGASAAPTQHATAATEQMDYYRLAIIGLLLMIVVLLLCRHHK